MPAGTPQWESRKWMVSSLGTNQPAILSHVLISHVYCYTNKQYSNDQLVWNSANMSGVGAYCAEMVSNAQYWHTTCLQWNIVSSIECETLVGIRVIINNNNKHNVLTISASHIYIICLTTKTSKAFWCNSI